MKRLFAEMGSIQLFLGLILAAVACGASPELAAAPPKPGIVVRGLSEDPSRPTRAWLIPSWLLQTPYDRWSREDQSLVSHQVIEDFESYIDSIQPMKRTVCTPGEGIPVDPPEAKARRKRTLYEVAGSQKNIVLGEVIGLEPAWDTGSYQIATLVQVKVDSVLRSVDGISPGDIVTFRRPWGALIVRGVELCSVVEGGGSKEQISASVSALAAGQRQRVLLLGRFVPGNSGFLSSGRFEEFQVFEGKIHYPPGIPYYPEEPELLSVALSREWVR